VLGKTFECKRVGGLVFTSDRPDDFAEAGAKDFIVPFCDGPQM
jgi:hypothetical protein